VNYNTYEKAEEFYMDGKYDEALKLFTILNKGIESNDCINYMGCCNIYLKNYQKAEKSFKYLIKKAPDWERPIFNLGRIYLKLGKMKEALSCFEKAVSINPKSGDAYFYMAYYYSEIGNNKKAINYYKKSLKFDYNDAVTHQNIGLCYVAEELYDIALIECDISLNLKFNNDTLFNKGICYFNMKEYEKSLNVFLGLYKFQQDDIQIMIIIFRCYCYLSDLMNMKKWNNKILKLQPDNERALKIKERIKQDLKKEKILKEGILYDTSE